MTYYERHKEQMKAYARQYHKDHAEQVKAYRKKYFKEVTEPRRKYYSYKKFIERPAPNVAPLSQCTTTIKYKHPPIPINPKPEPLPPPKILEFRSGSITWD